MKTEQKSIHGELEWAAREAAKLGQIADDHTLMLTSIAISLKRIADAVNKWEPQP